MTGYHLCVNRKWKVVTIHAPTDRWQHLPRAESKTCYWLGPYATEDEAQDAAQEEAEWNDYDVQRRCRKCFHTPQALRWAQKRARERDARSDWMPEIGQQPSQPGIISSRRR